MAIDLGIYTGDYTSLEFAEPAPGVLEIVMGEEGTKLSTATAGLHKELAEIWLDIDRDDETRVAILRGAGRGFSGGGDLGMVEEITRDFNARIRVWKEARDIVYNVINCSKMIVSAMHGPAVGAGTSSSARTSRGSPRWLTRSAFIADQLSRSMTMAMPWPPPTHIDSRP